MERLLADRLALNIGDPFKLGTQRSNWRMSSPISQMAR